MDPTLKAILVGAVLAVFGYFLGGLRQKKVRIADEDLRKEALAVKAVEEANEKIAKLELAVALLQRAAVPIEAALQASFLASLKHDDKPDVDILLNKAEEGKLTKDEKLELNAAMKERGTDPTVGEAEQIKARILPDIMRLNELLEESTDECETKTQLVTVPATIRVAAPDGGTQIEEKGN